MQCLKQVGGGGGGMGIKLSDDAVFEASWWGGGGIKLSDDAVFEASEGGGLN